MALTGTHVSEVAKSLEEIRELQQTWSLPVHVHDDSAHETEHELNPNRRAKLAFAAGSLGSLALAGLVEYKAGVSKDMLGLVSNAVHNLGDGLIHGLRASALAARETMHRTKSRTIRRIAAVAMGATTSFSVFHTGEYAVDLIDDPGWALEFGSALFSKEAIGSVIGNVAIALGLNWGTKGTDFHAETASHGKRDSVEAVLNVVSTINPAFELAGGAAMGVWGKNLTQKMWNNAEGEINCGHAHKHGHEDDHAHDVHRPGLLQRVTKKVKNISVVKNVTNKHAFPWSRADAALGAISLANEVCDYAQGLGFRGLNKQETATLMRATLDQNNLTDITHLKPGFMVRMLTPNQVKHVLDNMW